MTCRFEDIKQTFITKCPCAECGNKVIRWLHSGCNCGLTIYNDGDIICHNCKTRFNIMEAVFNCQNESVYSSPYNKMKKRDILRILINSPMEPYFIKRIIKRIMLMDDD